MFTIVHTREGRGVKVNKALSQNERRNAGFSLDTSLVIWLQAICLSSPCSTTVVYENTVSNPLLNNYSNEGNPHQSRYVINGNICAILAFLKILDEKLIKINILARKLLLWNNSCSCFQTRPLKNLTKSPIFCFDVTKTRSVKSCFRLCQGKLGYFIKFLWSSLKTSKKPRQCVPF